MNNIEKKLDALIDALGFDVEEVRSPLDDFAVSEWNNKWRNANTSHVPPKPTATINYKLTKRNDPQRKYNLYMSALIEYQSGATTLEEFTEITKGLL
tara:strand:- start:78 stop:368 length:291 start_codon:yes stop_codon:yes gene_type:complete